MKWRIGERKIIRRGGRSVSAGVEIGFSDFTARISLHTKLTKNAKKKINSVRSRIKPPNASAGPTAGPGVWLKIHPINCTKMERIKEGPIQIPAVSNSLFAEIISFRLLPCPKKCRKNIAKNITKKGLM